MAYSKANLVDPRAAIESPHQQPCQALLNYIHPYGLRDVPISRPADIGITLQLWMSLIQIRPSSFS